MTVQGSRVTVTTTATLLADATGTDSVTGVRVTVKSPSGAQIVDLGGPGVTAGAGLALEAGNILTLELGPGDALYGIVAATTQAVHVLKTGT
jgi:hypothetical protein